MSRRSRCCCPSGSDVVAQPLEIASLPCDETGPIQGGSSPIYIALVDLDRFTPLLGGADFAGALVWKGAYCGNNGSAQYGGLIEIRYQLEYTSAGGWSPGASSNTSAEDLSSGPFFSVGAASGYSNALRMYGGNTGSPITIRLAGVAQLLGGDPWTV